MSYPNPCDACSVENCYHGCEAWRIRYLYRQKQINAYARKGRRQEEHKQNVFVYEHPDIVRRYLEKGPCGHCQRLKVCDTPCAAYWRWWDARMEWLKRKFKNEVR